jgi:hypothetical protein
VNPSGEQRHGVKVGQMKAGKSGKIFHSVSKMDTLKKQRWAK